MSCTHRAPDRYVEQVWDLWTGAAELVRAEGASKQVDVSIGAWQCTQCGEVGYYTGNWKRYYEEGTPCAGSDTVSRKLPNAPPNSLRVGAQKAPSDGVHLPDHG